MHTYHIHINGLVQGVGFRPFICRLAREFELTGWVSNTTNGVHIELNATDAIAQVFYKRVLSDPPANAIITHHHLEETRNKHFPDFSIRQSNHENKPDLLLTPDIALCAECREEILTQKNKRFYYPFTTCLECGPRYSIITDLPYDRQNTTMQSLQMCDTCLAEYNNIENRRHFSQTNSCKACAVPMHLFNAPNSCISSDADGIIEFAIDVLNSGSIIAVKGIGGYLLMCDATNEAAINTLRTRKKRLRKPFALLYRDIEMAGNDARLHPFEAKALQDKVAPIVLCQVNDSPASGICKAAIAPDLDKIGLMLPYTPLLLLIAGAFNKPLIATSANISGSPIIYKDADALKNLFEVADYLLTFERAIVAPQDDSVIQFNQSGQKIVLRRSRGLAPNYFPNPFPFTEGTVLAMGSELKSAFALLDQNNLYISQYLGDQGTLESQSCFKETLQHLTKLVKTSPEHILIDKHPGYFVSQYGKEISNAHDILLTAIQHHKAHFGAVLAENNLLESKEPVLGFTWDGTGYGDDNQIWGGEVFIFDQKEMERAAYLDYFPQLLGDKMSKEPRLSALSLLKHLPQHQTVIKNQFSHQEWKYYQQLIQQPATLLTSSMGRFLDGIAAILGIRMYNSYEGEAAMQLEAMARNCIYKTSDYYPIPLANHRLDWQNFLIELIEDHQQKIHVSIIARKVFFSLVKMVEQVSSYLQIDKIAFSGGVFQNAFLAELLVDQLGEKRQLYFHQQLSPNDECIGFGQLACYSLLKKTKNTNITATEKITIQQLQFTN